MKDGILVSADTVEEAAEYRCECQRYRGDGYCGEDGPEQEGVPLPEPELAGEGKGTFSGGAEEFTRRERHGCGVEDAAGDADKRDDEYELERIDDVVADLRCGQVEAKDKCQSKAEDGGAAEDGIDANEEAGGDAPGQLFRRCSHAEKSEDGKGDAAVDPVVVDGSGVLAGVAVI